MIAITKPQSPRRDSRSASQPGSASPGDRFVELLPAIRRHARYAFRRLNSEAREEAVAEVIASAFVAYSRLVEQGKEHLAYASPLARFGVAQLRDGRKVGVKRNVRDVLSPRCQQKKQVSVDSIHRWDRTDEEWKEVLVEDQRATPADLAASRIDFPAWLETLSDRDRRLALTLSRSESTKDTARKFKISPARVSQLRQELAASWKAFHGEELPNAATAAR